jgi:hypothetical protein
MIFAMSQSRRFVEPALAASTRNRQSTYTVIAIRSMGYLRLYR